MTEHAVEFVKMSGSGNDFIIVDNREGDAAAVRDPAWVAAVCRRAVSLGADGVIFIEHDPHGEVDFAWQFYNSDGSEAEMCGNGGRCAVRYAFDAGVVARPEMAFRTRVGVIRGWALGGREVRVGLTDPRDYRPRVELATPGGPVVAACVDTGVPHAVVQVDDIENLDVVGRGRPLRYHPAFAPRGANVDFVKILGPRTAAIRTYERGVEAETLACGTGCAAGALTLGRAGALQIPAEMVTRGGETLVVDYRLEAGQVRGLTLQGPVRYVARGLLDPEAWA
jgi:diaminopimelate epimerase